MKVVLDNIVFSLQKSGGVSVVWSEHLKRIVQQGRWRLSFIEYDNARENIFRKKLDLNIHQDSSRFLWAKRYMNPRVQSKTPYIFHSSYYRVSGDGFSRNITTIHDFTYEYFAGGMKKFVHSSQKQYAATHSDRIICISQNTKEDLLRLIPRVNPDIVSVVYNGVGNDFFRLPASEKASLNLPFRRKEYLLFVGSRESYKNFFMSVRAAKLAKMPLIIVGGGSLTDGEKDFLDKTIGHEHYFHPGRIDNALLNYLYNHAFCLLYPSNYEGFGIPVLEAQKAGCPVIASYVSSIPEVIGDTKLKLERINENLISEAIRELNNNVSLRTHEITQGLSNVERFSWDKTFEDTMAVYRSLL